MRITPNLTVVALLAVTPAVSTPAFADDSLGRRAWVQCQACHSVKKGEPHKVGPNLFGMVGAKAGTRPGYRYSPALANSGLVWNDATLDRWLQRPSAVVPKNKMVYSGMARADQRRALIAYLKRITR